MQTAQPESVGMSSERLARADRYLARAVEGDSLPGIIALAQRRGEIVHHSVVGKMDIAARRPMQTDAIFRIYSMTKPVVSLALMMLHDEGWLQLHDPVSRYIPAFAKTKVISHISDNKPVLVDQDPPHEHLSPADAYGWLELRRGSWHPADEAFRQAAEAHGFFQRDTPLQQDGRTHCRVAAALPAGQQLALQRRQRCRRLPGATDCRYAAGGLPARAHIRATGPWTTPASPCRQRRQTVSAPFTGRDAAGVPKLIPHDEVANGDVRLPTSCPSGGGGLVSTAADYLRFARMLLNGGQLDGARLVSPMTIQRMTSNAVPREMLPLRIGIERYGYGFGLGFRVMLDVGRANGYSSVGEYGWSGVANTHVVIDPRQQLITLMMTQMWSEQPHRPRSIYPNLIYQALDDL